MENEPSDKQKKQKKQKKHDSDDKNKEISQMLYEYEYDAELDWE